MDQDGGVGDDDTDDQTGSPERLRDVTAQPLATADLQIREPGGGFGFSISLARSLARSRQAGGMGEFDRTEESIAAGDYYLSLPAHAWAVILISQSCGWRSLSIGMWDLTVALPYNTLRVIRFAKLS